MAHWLDKVIDLLQAQTDDLRELARIAGANPETFYLGIDPTQLDIAGQDLTGIEFSRAEAETKIVVGRIRKATRQEERIAMLLDALLQNRNSGLAILNLYQTDKAKFANYALEKIRNLFSDATTADKFESGVAALIPHFFSYTYPLNRGRLLYFLALYLGKYPQVNKAINASLTKTASMFVEFYRSRIVKLLNRQIAELNPSDYS